MRSPRASRTKPPAVALLAPTALVLCLVARPGAAVERRLEVTPELERAVSRGLDYLARTQTPDGSWPDSYGKVSGVVGLAVLTFLAHGEVPDEGKYGAVIRKGVDYILKSQQSNALLSGSGGSPMYSHGFATLALAEVYGVIDDPRVGPALKRAVGLIVSSQNDRGGWRYSVGSSDADTTVSGAQMVALRAAANAGIEVPIETIQRGVAYYKSCFCPGGGFGYTGPSGPNMARSGIGLLVLSLSGAYRSPETKATADWLFAHGTSHDSYFYYACYYCSQAMYQAGGKYWEQWNETATPLLISMQQPDGSWPNRGSGGIVCGTAMALLALEVNYNFLPIYQR
ncbi:MAG: prenyltransferase/squalene oxidase repeat-containing protein [Candidatus Brocadiia bacterium]